jgi:hypothetical protein
MDYFGVSRSALLFRLQDLELIAQDLAVALGHFSVSAVATRTGIEFRDRKYIGTRLPELAIHAWRLGHITAGRAAELCDLDVQMFREVMHEIGEHQEIDEGAPLIGAAAGR